MIGMGIGLNYCKAILSPSLSFDWLNTNSLTSQEGYPLTFTRASQATYWGSDGLLKTATNNEARFEYDPNTLVKRGLKIEPQATNLLLRSEDYANAYWGKTDITATLTSETAGIRGSLNEATKIQEGSTGTALMANTVVTTTASTIYTFSKNIKRGNTDWVCLQLLDSGGTNGGRAWFNLNTKTKGTTATIGSGASISSDIEILQNGFVKVFIRCTISTSTSMVGGIFSASADSSTTRVANANYYLCGSQIELGQYPTSYIPTTTATITRSADVATMSTGAWYNASEGSALATYYNRGIETANNYSLISFTDGTFSNRMVFRNFANSNGQTQMIWANGGVNIAISLPLIAINVKYNVAIGFRTNDYVLAINNTQIENTSAIFTNAINRLDIGNSINGVFNGHISSFKYYNRKLPNATLKALTV